MSIPEPPPQNKGECVTDKLIEYINMMCIGMDIKSETIELIQQRSEFGYKKYGQYLMTQDGRNTIEDARQELGDLLQYVFKARMNGEDISCIKRMLPVLVELLN